MHWYVFRGYAYIYIYVLVRFHMYTCTLVRFQMYTYVLVRFRVYIYALVRSGMYTYALVHFRMYTYTLACFQRVHNKQVSEQAFFSLVQYFAIVLFECNESEDFGPAKTLMNMCFTFYYEGLPLFIYISAAQVSGEGRDEG